MSELRRFGRKALAAMGVAGALVGLTMFVVLPALASTPGTPVPPASSPGGVTPIDVQTGGQDNDCSLFYPAGSTLHAFYVDNPKTKSYTDPATGATFNITTNPTPSTSWPSMTRRSPQPRETPPGTAWLSDSFLRIFMINLAMTNLMPAAFTLLQSIGPLSLL